MPYFKANSSVINSFDKSKNHFPSRMVTFLTYKTFEYKNKCERNLPKLQIKIQSELEACTFNTAWHCCSHYELHSKKEKLLTN